MFHRSLPKYGLYSSGRTSSMTGIDRLALPLAWLALLLAAPPVRCASPEVVFERASASVVVVERFDERGQRTGLASGVVVAPGAVVTSCHAMSGASAVQVRRAERRHGALLRYADTERDLCQLTVADLDAPPAPLRTGAPLKVGQRVYAIGAPRGLELTLSEGLISALRASGGAQMIQTSAPMSRGSSGGGLFDVEGRLIGIATFQLARGQNLNFAVPANWIAEIPRRANRPTRGFPTGVRSTLSARAEWLEATRNWPALSAHARAWMQREPTSGAARRALARSYSEMERLDNAIDAYRSALRIEPRQAGWWLELGEVHRRAGDASSALAAYRNSVNRNPKLSQAWIALARAFAAERRTPEAIDALRHAVRAQPELAAGWQTLAASYADVGRHDLAIAAAREGLRSSPRAPELWFELASAYAELDQRAQALAAFQEVLRIEPEHVDALYGVGAVYATQGDTERADAVYSRLRGLAGERAEEFRSRYLNGSYAD
jgi:tetratricopeptide (TPR) repeat protein